MLYEKYVKRFWSYVDIGPEIACWWWKKNKTKQGYGCFSFRGKSVFSHRFAYEAFNGEGTAVGRVIRHTCDNPSCCNPKHLLAGTHKDNMRDKFERGRAKNLKGDECSWSKLTSAEVLSIRKMLSSRSLKDLSETFNLDKATLSDIKYRRTWKDVGTEYVFDKQNSKHIRTYVKELLGRKTLEGVFIYHVDRDRKNSSSSNIVLCPSSSYVMLIRQRSDAYDACGHADWIKCTYCKKYDDPKNLYQKSSEAKFRSNESFYRFHKECQLEYQRLMRRK